VQSSFRKVAAAANALNAASDRFSRLVGEIDTLLKPLNIGIPCWVTVSNWSTENDRGEDQVGYAKINGKWCIGLRSVSDFSEQCEDWVFSEGPRRMRLKAVDYLAELLDELAKKTEEGTASITEKTSYLEDLVSGLKQEAIK
jgi:hypothetical protein